MLKQQVAPSLGRYPALPFGLEDDTLTRAWVMCVGFLLAVSVLVLPAFYFDSRQLDGISFWYKPLKFSLSLAMHFATLALLAQQLPRRCRTSITLAVVGYPAVAAMLFEQVYITLQAARGQRSHFNVDNEVEMALYGVMGVGAVLLVLATFVLGVMIWRYGPKNGSGLRFGSIVGLMLGSVLTVIFGWYMGSQPAHLVQAAGTVVNDASGMPVVGWSRRAGDLRIPHFVATHIMQVLPLLGLLLDRLRLPSRGVLAVGALLLTLACVGLLELAVAGKPLIALG
jgi:hypothetical protein